VVDEEPARTSWLPRLLAPLAFFAAATLLVVLVNSAMDAANNGEADATPPAAPTANPSTTDTRPGRVPRSQRRFYRIKAGDTLDQIAGRFDTTVDDLLRINPGIDAQALTPGQRIRIR
jgi:Tfp pilus assembly protein FimV